MVTDARGISSRSKAARSSRVALSRWRRAPARNNSPKPSWSATSQHAHPGQRLAVITRDYHDLLAGGGRWHDTPTGTAARDRNQARATLEDARRRSENPKEGWRARRFAARSLPTLTAAVAAAEAQWQDVGQPEADRLLAEQPAARRDVDNLRFQALRDDLTAALRRLDRIEARPAEPDLDIGLGL